MILLDCAIKKWKTMQFTKMLYYENSLNFVYKANDLNFISYFFYRWKHNGIKLINK